MTAGNQNNTITPQKLNQQRDRGEPAHIVDVRTPIEYAQSHIANTQLMPLDKFDMEALRRAAGDAPIYLLCRTGRRAAEACEQLRQAGIDAAVIEGGLVAWEQAGLPVERNRSVISLERQVRIAAGSLVLLGVLLGWLIHPTFLALSAFVGGGLVFAGITDWCGMAMLLANAPWNRCASPNCQSHTQPQT